MIGCSDRLDGTWLNSAMKTAYLALRDAGHLISFEVWDHSFVQESEPAPLVGGLYGILVDGVFAAESKFHRKTDASKVALVCAVSELFAAGLQLFDVQFLTQHLSTLGVFEINRTRYLRALEAARSHNVRLSASPEDLIPAAVERLGLKSVPAKEPGFS
jgi:leucyl/phenylalanyl-tRNA---protein transferase